MALPSFPPLFFSLLGARLNTFVYFKNDLKNKENEEIVELAHQQTDINNNSEIEELSQEEIFENKEEENEGSIEFQTVEENRKTNKSDLKAAHNHQHKILIDVKWFVNEDFLKEDPFIYNKYIFRVPKLRSLAKMYSF